MYLGKAERGQGKQDFDDLNLKRGNQGKEDRRFFFEANDEDYMHG